MEIMEIGDPVMQWDRKLSELSEKEENDSLYNTPFSELLDDSALLDVLGQLMGDPFLNEKYEMMEVETNPSSPSPMIKAEHSYSLCGDSRPQSPFTHGSSDDNFSDADLTGDDWCLNGELTSTKIKIEVPLESTGLIPSVTLTTSTASVPSVIEAHSQLSTSDETKILNSKLLPQIKLEAHEVDQFLNLYPKEGISTNTLLLPPTPPSSHGSDSEGCQSPGRSLPPLSPAQSQTCAKVVARNSSVLSNSPLLTAPHKLQGSGPLMLTEEEKRTLIAEGYPIPTKLPLSKAEEKALKKIRRKIKNKISAQESRRKKKEYMDSLEKRIENCSSENNELRKKVEVLETTNRTLMQQLQCLQAMVGGKVSRSYKAASTQTGTCLMLVVLCFALIFGSFTQNFDPYPTITKTMAEPIQQSIPEPYASSVVRSRNLLIFDENKALEELHTSAVTLKRLDSWRKKTESISQYPTTVLEEYSFPHEKSQTPLNDSKREVALHHRFSLELGQNEPTSVVELDRRVNATFK